MSDALDAALASLAAARKDAGEWRPRRFVADLPADREALSALIRDGAVELFCDEIDAQLGELVELRSPDRKFTPDELSSAVAAHLAGRLPSTYGTFVYYPWARRVVHVLPEDEYVLVRTSRNRNKITIAEQARLGRLRVGIAGLSVGQSTAVTLALEGVGGHFVLADFDTINLSNLNRLRAGAHAIGVNKAVLTAREIFELNPYAEVTLFPNGVRDDNLDAFLDGLDLLFEECDDLKMKVRLREAARQRRVATLMETSDRGLFDVERFDLEPDRPIFHGLTGELRAADLEGLSTFEKVPVVLRIIGETTMSRRMAASLVDIDTTIKSWPQLASAVALGGAVNTDAARRIALGEMRDSGRFFVDLSTIIRDGSAEPLPPDEAPAKTEVVLPPLRRLTGGFPLREEQVLALVERGALAPSGGNCQPWRFRFRAGTLDCFIDRARARSFLDFADAASHLAIGAAAENVCLAARTIGLDTAVEPFPDGPSSDLVCRLRFTPGAPPDPEADRLAAQIEARATNRRIAPRSALTDAERAALRASVGDARLQLLESPAALAEIASVLGRGDRLRFLSRQMHGEMMGELRWSSAEAARTRDGLDVATLELSAADTAGMRLVSRWPIMETLGVIGGGEGLTKSTKKAIAGAAAVGLLTISGTSPERYFTGGRRLERAWLCATALGLQFQPMTALVYLFARLEHGGDGLAAEEIDELRALRARYRGLFEIGGDAELMLFRVGRAAPPSARSLRRDAADILEII